MAWLIHSAKGTTWKDHKYIRKEGNRYFYKNSSDRNELDKKKSNEDIAAKNDTLTNLIMGRKSISDTKPYKAMAKANKALGDFVMGEYDEEIDRTIEKGAKVIDYILRGDILGDVVEGKFKENLKKAPEKGRHQ